MTETTTTSTRPDQEEANPADILMNLIIAFLAPMFLCGSNGNINFARMAAIDTVNAYRARDQADLVSIAQIIAFGLTALGSLSLSMADNLSLSMTLRLRANANALNRSAQQNRRALTKDRRDASAPPVEDAAETSRQATVIADVAEAQRSTAEALVRAADPVAPQMTAEQRHQARWASAMTDIAAEQTAALHNLPPLERKAATFRAAALSSTANTLLAKAGLPQRPVQPRS